MDEADFTKEEKAAAKKQLAECLKKLAITEIHSVLVEELGSFEYEELCEYMAE